MVDCRVRRVLPIAFAGFAAFSLARWWPAGTPGELSHLPAATPVPVNVASATPVPAKEPDRKDRKVRERFAVNFKTRDPFGSARVLLPEIEAMAAEDFRQLEQDKQWPSAESYGFDQEFAHAFADALVERWLTVDPAGAVAGMFRLSKSMHHGTYMMAGADDMVEALARVRPELFLEETLKEGSARSFDRYAEAAFQSLATRDIAAARRWLDRLTDPDKRSKAEMGIGLGVAESDPVAAMALARETRNEVVFRAALTAAAKLGPGVLGQVLDANEGMFSGGNLAPLLMFRYPDLPWDRLENAAGGRPAGGGIRVGTLSLGGKFGQASDRLPGIEINVLNEANRIEPADREGILTQLQRLPDAVGKDAVGAILFAWGLDDPKAAIGWDVAHSEPREADGSKGYAPMIFSRWMRADSNAALEWFRALPASELRDRLANDASIPLAASGDTERALAFFRPMPGKEGEAQVSQMAAAQAKSDPARAAAWCASLPAEIDVSGATQSIVTAWFSNDAAAAAKWVESLPEGNRREVALNAYAQVASTRDPEAAGAWVAAIKDPKERTCAAHQVFSAMLNADREAAIQWVREFPGIDERLREAILRTRKP
jgi:hypothetical protein